MGLRNPAGKSFRVIFKVPGSPDIHVSVPEGVSLLEAARQADVAVDAPCSGNGTCGKCLVRIRAGNALTGRTRHITPDQYAEGWRLACQTTVEANLTIQIPEGTGKFKSRMRITDFSNSRERQLFEKLRTEMEVSGFSRGSGLEFVTLTLSEPGIQDSMADRERLLAALAERAVQTEGAVCVARDTSVGSGVSPVEACHRYDISLSALRKLPCILRESGFSCTCVVKHEENTVYVLDVFPPGGEPKGKDGRPVLPGLAVDIGTTTVALVITDLLSGEILAMGSEGNGQIRYGADVINRIIESTREGGLERLRRAVLDDTIIPLIKKAAAATGIETGQIYRTAIAGNTTMAHLFAGVSPEYLRLEPYVPAFFHGDWRPGDLGLPVHPDGKVLMAPAVGSYVGGDITAGVFASMIFHRDHYSLFIDLGTNGELVFGGRDWLMTCACSAGPAFEGGDISCGMRAAAGAAEACTVNAETMEPELTVIGGGKLAGLCGSGLIDLVGELFAAGIINARGKLVREGGGGNPRIRRDEWGMGSYVLAFEGETENGTAVTLTEGDIDNFIRAKGAIFSAIRTMLAMVDLEIDAVEEVFIAGGIGSGINIAQAIRIGMLPAIPLQRYHYIGNTSLSGAWAMVQSEKAAEKTGQIAESMTYLELSSHPHYMDEFIGACFLPHTNGDLFT
jgi:uncharacterized 2Fe-2S/4Fe-4S cluster protein (DUF4445 family)